MIALCSIAWGAKRLTFKHCNKSDDLWCLFHLLLRLYSSFNLPLGSCASLTLIIDSIPANFYRTDSPFHFWGADHSLDKTLQFSANAVSSTIPSWGVRSLYTWAEGRLRPNICMQHWWGCRLAHLYDIMYYDARLFGCVSWIYAVRLQRCRTLNSTLDETTICKRWKQFIRLHCFDFSRRIKTDAVFRCGHCCNVTLS